MKVGDLLSRMCEEDLGLTIYVSNSKITLPLKQVSDIWKCLNQDLHCFRESEKGQDGDIACGNVPESEQCQSSGEKPEEATPLDVTDHPVPERNMGPSETNEKVAGKAEKQEKTEKPEKTKLQGKPMAAGVTGKLEADPEKLTKGEGTHRGKTIPLHLDVGKVKAFMQQDGR